MRNSVYSVTIDEALVLAGGHHRYQKAMLLVLLGLWSACFAVHLELQGTVYSLGLLGGACFGSYFSNSVGRKKVAVASSILAGSALVASSVLGGYQWAVGLCTGSLLSSSFLLFVEVLDEVDRALYVGILFCSRGVATVALLSGPFVLGGILAVFSVLLCWFYESPRYLAAVRGKYSEARHTLNAIAQVNRRAGFPEILEGEEVVGYQENGTIPGHNERDYSYIQVSEEMVTVTYSEIRNLRKHGLYALFTSSVGGWVLWLVFASLLLSVLMGTLESMGTGLPNSQMRLLMTGAAEVLGGLFTGISLKYLGKQMTVIICLLFSSLLTAMYIILTYSGGVEFDPKAAGIVLCLLLVTVKCLFLGMSIIIYLVSVEVLPTNIRAQGFSLMELSLKGGLFLSTGLFYVCESLSVKSSAVLCICLLLSCQLLCRVSDDTGCRMDDYLGEDIEDMKRPVDSSQ